MGSHQDTGGYILQPATAADANTIRRIIYLVQNNPLALDWHRFILAVDRAGRIIGCGQVKPHADGTLELASLSVLPEWRNRGVARAIIEHLLEQNPGRLYLTCQTRLEPLYQKFGFQTIDFSEMPPYFRRISRLVGYFNKIAQRPNQLSVMRRN